MVRKILVKSFIAIILIMLYLPIVWMIVFSFTDTPSFSNWNGFTLDNYINLFTGESKNAELIQSALFNTLFVGFFVSLLSTVLGTLGAIGLHKSRVFDGEPNSHDKQRNSNRYRIGVGIQPIRVDF